MVKSKKKAADKQQLITDQLLSLLDQGTLPWRRPWQKTPCANALTERRYRGTNPLLVEISVLARGYKTPLFVGFKQAREAGWQMQKGSKATYVRSAGSFEKTEATEDGKEMKKRIGFSKWIPIFNIDCFSDNDSSKVRIADVIAKYAGPPNDAPRIEDAEAFVAAQKAEISFGGDRAFYAPSSDRIQLPAYERFSSAEAYYATLAHELGHWTGHESRENRELLTKTSKVDYAFEELVAEISAAIVCGHLNLEPQLENHASYLESWQKLLKGDNQAFFRAVALAQQAANLLLGNAGLLPEDDD